MITVALSATIGASPERVWRAVVDPAERERWDERILGTVASRDAKRRAARDERSARSERGTRSERGERGDHAAGSKREPLRRTRWRFKLGGVPMVLKDEVLGVRGHEQLKSRVTIGSMHFDQTLTLHSEDDEAGPRTRLGMKIVASNSIAVIGEVVPRLDVQKLVIEYVDATLRQVRKHCESEA